MGPKVAGQGGWLFRRTLDAAYRYGMDGSIVWNKAEVAATLFQVGRWDEALSLVDAEIARHRGR